MSVTYTYDMPVGGATMMQVSYYSGDQNKVIELEAVLNSHIDTLILSAKHLLPNL